MRTIVASGLALALLAHAAIAPADQASLPAGWVPGAGLAPLQVPKVRTWGGFQSNHEFTFPVRRTMPGARHDVDALPVVEMDPPVPPRLPAELPGGAEGDLSVARKGTVYRLSLRGFDIGFVQVNGSTPAAIGPRAQGGAVGACGDGKVVPLSYEGIRRVDAGSGIELVWARGWFDTGRCRAAIVERHEVRPANLAVGLVYAFRTRCAACGEDARDALHVITPQMNRRFDVWTPFEHHTLPLGPGKAAAFEGDTLMKSSWRVTDWPAVIDFRCGERDLIFCTPRVRVEVSQGRGETSPTLFVSGDVER